MTGDDNPHEMSELVMPFVVCRSQGGKYDDGSFVAGFEAGTLDLALRTLAPVGGAITRTVPTALLPQLDLIAMRHGFEMTSKAWDEDDFWSFVEFHSASHDAREDQP